MSGRPIKRTLRGDGLAGLKRVACPHPRTQRPARYRRPVVGHAVAYSSFQYHRLPTFRRFFDIDVWSRITNPVAVELADRGSEAPAVPREP